MFIRNLMIGFVSLFLLTACDPMTEKIKTEIVVATENIDLLKSKFDNGELPNALILKTYIQKTKATNPDFMDVLNGFVVQATSKNTGIVELEKRVASVEPNVVDGKWDEEIALAELYNIRQAANVDVFNKSLIDEINTVAALSNGALSSLDISDEDAKAEPGKNLIGNPKYGQWQSSSNGSFWVWFATYSYFSNRYNRSYYHGWYYNRPWSYGYDNYYNNYGSRGWKSNETSVMDKNYTKVREYGKNNNRKPTAYSSRNNSKVKAAPAGKGQALSSVRKSTAQYGTTARKSSPYSSSSRSGSRSSSSRGGK